MLIHPGWDPVAVQIGPVSIHWYALMYLAAFAAFYGLGRKKGLATGQWQPEQVSDLLYYGAFGVILGGRIGYMLFYQMHALTQDPLALLRVWEGGMSFHGGLAGVILAMWWYGKRTQRSFFQVADFVAPLVPIGLGLGRLGNFINAELPGRVSEHSWAMIFPLTDSLPRHPSQLYQAFAEGLVLFVVLWLFGRSKPPLAAMSGLFVLSYGVLRFTTEFFREPDAHLGFVALDWMSMGQVLSLPLIVLGIFILIWSYKRVRHEKLS